MRNKKEGRIISLDPGVRLFVTRNDPEENVVEFCKNDFSRFSRLCVRHNKYQCQSTIFEIQEMVRRAKRKIRTKTAHNMLAWSHFRFRQ